MNDGECGLANSVLPYLPMPSNIGGGCGDELGMKYEDDDRRRHTMEKEGEVSITSLTLLVVSGLCIKEKGFP